MIKRQGAHKTELRFQTYLAGQSPDRERSIKVFGGETGIRTLGAREGTTVFETAPFDRSGTSPTMASLTEIEITSTGIPT